MKIKFSDFIGIAVVLSFIAFAFTLLFVKVPEENKTMVNIILGTLGAGGFSVILNYIFGSSAGSKAKDDTISSITKP